MSGLVPAVAVSLGAGALGAAVLLVAPLEGQARTGALLGVAASSLVGLTALLLKAWLTRGLMKAPKEVQALRGLLQMQGLSLGLRVVGVGVGALVLRLAGLDAVAFVLAFFVVYLVQQVVEVRYVLAAQRAAGLKVSR